MAALARAGSWVLRAAAALAGAALLALGAMLVPQTLGYGYQDSPRALYAGVSLLYLLSGCALLRLARYRRRSPYECANRR